MKQMRDYKNSVPVYTVFFFLSFTSLIFGGLVLMGNKLESKTDDFRRGSNVIEGLDSKIFRIFSKDLFPTLLYCNAMKATISVPHVCRAVLSMSCASALSKNTCTRQSHGENATKRGDCINPVLNTWHISSEYFCFKSRIVLLKAFSLYLCFYKIIFFWYGYWKMKKKDLTRHFCQKIGRVGRVTLNTGNFFFGLIDLIYLLFSIRKAKKKNTCV